MKRWLEQKGIAKRESQGSSLLFLLVAFQLNVFLSVFYIYTYTVPLMLPPVIALSAAYGFCLIKWRNDSSPARGFLNET